MELEQNSKTLTVFINGKIEKKCEIQVKDPENDFYNGNEFWRCKCGQINYIK